ncbi:hypothetical protein F751_2109 [Auxenochlorella protothecoides]|uniref:Uncharacterized protein n=1 Tax=Auxenochlorella protothecoides TaxID=3075 RepID=A0A087SLB8_AUXPR|nr:hypothetical protein F751_2109 [Auxenochlorella protothecoides]KFM26522.1 hypothetical protein F751_2109 [Auxenochlorella protothecoides]
MWRRAGGLGDCEGGTGVQMDSPSGWRCGDAALHGGTEAPSRPAAQQQHPVVAPRHQQ